MRSVSRAEEELFMVGAASGREQCASGARCAVFRIFPIVEAPLLRFRPHPKCVLCLRRDFVRPHPPYANRIAVGEYGPSAVHTRWASEPSFSQAFVRFGEEDYDLFFVSSTKYNVVHRNHMLFGFQPSSVLISHPKLDAAWTARFSHFCLFPSCSPSPPSAPPPPPPPPLGLKQFPNVCRSAHVKQIQPYYLYCSTCKKLKNLCLEPFCAKKFSNVKKYKEEMKNRQIRQGATGCAYDVELGTHVCMGDRSLCAAVDLRTAWTWFYGRLLVLCAGCACPTFADDDMVRASFDGNVLCSACADLKRERIRSLVARRHPHHHHLAPASSSRRPPRV